VDTSDVREFAAQVDRAIADPATDRSVLDRLLDSAATVAAALDGETTRLHREIDRAIDAGPGAVNGLTRDLRECYRDLELLRPRVRALRAVIEERPRV
jgi:hypothetical protein